MKALGDLLRSEPILVFDLDHSDDEQQQLERVVFDPQKVLHHLLMSLLTNRQLPPSSLINLGKILKQHTLSKSHPYG
jgi:hypothetical protein